MKTLELLELLPPGLYQELTRRSISDDDPAWGSYFLLLQGIIEALQKAPVSVEACDQVNIEDLTIDTLETLGKAIGTVLPGGAREFSSYMPFEWLSVQ